MKPGLSAHWVDAMLMTFIENTFIEVFASGGCQGLCCLGCRTDKKEQVCPLKRGPTPLPPSQAATGDKA